jgi:multidrug efflux pump subunit AcrB
MLLPGAVPPLASLAGGTLAAALVFFIGTTFARVGRGPLAAWLGWMRGRAWARLVDHRLWMMGIGLGALVLTFVLMQAIPTQFFPDTDTDESQIDVEMVPGTTIEQTEAKMDEVLALVAHEQEVRVALERIKEGSGHIFLQLRRDRHRTSVSSSAT